MTQYQALRSGLLSCDAHAAGPQPYGDYSNDDATSGSGFWSGIDINAALTDVTKMVSSIFSPSSKWQAQSNYQMYQQEKQTNTILWVVIGLILALGVVLLLRKTK